MRRLSLLIISCFAFLMVAAQQNADFTVEYASNLSALDSWSDISKFQWKTIDHGVMDNGDEMERLVEVVKNAAPKDTVGFYKQFFDARDNQYIVLRMDQARGERLFHVRVSNIASSTDPKHNTSKTYSTRDYVYISPLRGEQQLEIKVWPYGLGEELAKTITYYGHSYGSRGARSVMLDRSRLVPGKYDLQYVKVNDETAKTDTVTISDLQPGKLYTFYDYLLTPIEEAWLRFDGFKRMRIDVDRWAEDLVTHFDDGGIGVMTGRQMPYLKHKWLEAPNPSYLDTRMFAPHDTLWINVFRGDKVVTDATNLVINTSLTNYDGTAKDNVSMPWGQKDGHFFVVTNGEPCAIEAYTKGYAPTIAYYRGAFDPNTGWLYEQNEDVNIYLSTTPMPESGVLVSKMEITALEAVDGKRGDFYLANIAHIDLANQPLTAVVNYDEYGSRKDEQKYVNGTLYDRMAKLTAVFTAKNNQMPGDRLYLRKSEGPEENKIKVDKLEGEGRKLHFPAFDYAYWDADFSLLDYLDINESGRPYLAVDDTPVMELPILCNFYIDIEETKKSVEEEMKKKLEPDEEGEEKGKGFFNGYGDLDISFKFPMAPPPLYTRFGVNLDFAKKKKVSAYGAIGLGIDFDFLDKDGATSKWKEGYQGLSKGQLGKFNKDKINIRSTNEDGLTNTAKWEDIVKKFSDDDDDGPFKFNAAAHIEAFMQYSIPLDWFAAKVKVADLSGLRFLDEININARASLDFSVKLSLLDLAETITSKVGGSGAVNWMRNNKYASKVIKAVDAGIDFKFNTLLTAKAGLYYYDDGSAETNPLKTHLLGTSFLGRVDAAARLGFKFDIIAASLEAGVTGVAGAYITGAAGDRMTFDRPFNGTAWSYRAGFGFYYKVHALFWDKKGEKMWGGINYKEPYLLSNKSNSNPFHKKYQEYMRTGEETKNSVKIPRRLPEGYVADKADLNFPVRFLSGGDSIIYKSDATTPNSRFLRVVSTGNPAIVSDYLTGGTGDYSSASTPTMDIAVFEQATRKLTDTEVAPSDDELVDCVIQNGSISDIYFTMKKAGGKWYRPRPITTNDETNMRPRVALDDNGHAAAIWMKGRLSRNFLLNNEEREDITNLLFYGSLMLSRFDGTDWSEPIELISMARNSQLSEYQLTMKDGEVFVAATRKNSSNEVSPVFIHVAADNKVTVSEAPMEKNNKFELRRVGSHNVLAQLSEVGTGSDSQIRIALNSYDMSGKADGALSTSVTTGSTEVTNFRLVADQGAQSLRNIGLMWVEQGVSAATDTICNIIKAARLVPTGQDMFVGTPLVMAVVPEDKQIYDFDGYMTDEKINGCYLVNDDSGTVIQRATAYFSNAFSYSIVFDQKENNALTSSVSDNIQTTFLVKVSNLGTSTINRCVLSVENVNDSIPLHVVVPPGMTAQERVTIPFKSGMAINTKLTVSYDDVLDLQKKQLPRFLARRQKRAFARRRGMKYTDEHSAEDAIFEQQTASLYADVPQLECYVKSQMVDEQGRNKFVVHVKNKFSRPMPQSYLIVLYLVDKERHESQIVGFVLPQSLYSKAEQEVPEWKVLAEAFREKGVGFFSQRSNYESTDLIVSSYPVKETGTRYISAVVRRLKNIGTALVSGNKNQEYDVVTVYPSDKTTAVEKVYDEGDSQASLRIISSGSQVKVSGAKPGEDVRLYLANGMILARQKASSQGVAIFDMPSAQRGLYLVSNDQETIKFNY